MRPRLWGWWWGRSDVYRWMKISLSCLRKNSWFQREMRKKILNWWRLVPNPASYNEYFMLELSWAWEPADSSKARGFGPSTRSYSGVFS